MDEKMKQIFSSVAAIVLCIVFLWCGNKFIWKAAVDPQTDPGDDPQLSDVIEPGTSDTQQTSDTALTDSTSAVTGDTTYTSADGTTLSSEVTSTTDAQATDSAVTTAGTTTTASQQSSSEGAGSTKSTAQTTVSTTVSTTASTTASSGTSSSVTPGAGFVAAPEGYFNDALFIGDSRMVGIGSQYARVNLPGAKFYADVGLASYKIGKSEASSVDFKGQKLSAVLASNKFSKVYLMMGINELGNDYAATAKKFASIIADIQAAQPGVRIYLCANLHVTANPRTSYPKLVTNANINALNAQLKTLVNGSSVVWLDINSVFDDANGYFRSDYTSDGVHPLAKYYITWAEWFAKNVVL